MGVLSLKKPARRSYSLVFDINSASVGVAVISSKEEKGIVVHDTHRSAIQYGEQSDAQSLGDYLAKAIVKAGTHGLESLGKIPTYKGSYSVHALVHAPWADSRSQRAEEDLELETKITKQLLQDFVVENLSAQEAQGRVQFDKHITRIELNGYNTTNPYNKEARHVAVSVLTSSMAAAIHQRIIDAFASVVPNHHVHMDAFVFAAMQLDTLFNHADAYTIVDVGGEYTSINIIRNGTVAGSSWAPFGTEYLVRAVAGEDPDARSTALSEVVMFLDNTCTPAQCRKIESALEIADAQWDKAFGDACAQLTKTSRIPGIVFLSVDKRYASWFERAVEQLDFGQFTVTGKAMNAELLGLESAQTELAFGADTKRDTLLALGALFVAS